MSITLEKQKAIYDADPRRVYEELEQVIMSFGAKERPVFRVKWVKNNLVWLRLVEAIKNADGASIKPIWTLVQVLGRQWRVTCGNSLNVTVPMGFYRIQPEHKWGLEISRIEVNTTGKGYGKCLMSQALTTITNVGETLRNEGYIKDTIPISLECTGAAGGYEIPVKTKLRFFSQFGFRAEVRRATYAKMVMDWKRAKLFAMEHGKIAEVWSSAKA